MTPRKLIESRVPLARGEAEHKWDGCDLYCPTCGSHPGFKCVQCGRVVDWELDTPLYEAIEILVAQEESRGD